MFQLESEFWSKKRPRRWLSIPKYVLRGHFYMDTNAAYKSVEQDEVILLWNA